MAERIWQPLPRRIVVFRALKLGDMLCAVPAFRALRAAFPNAEIVLAGLPWAAEFVDRYRGFLDGFREFPGYPGPPEQEPATERVESFLTAMRAEQFDLCVQMHGSGGITNDLTARLGARQRAGVFEPGKTCPDPGTFLPYPDSNMAKQGALAVWNGPEHQAFRDDLSSENPPENRRSCAVYSGTFLR